MSRPLSLLKRFWAEEDGATMIEYGLMVALIAIAMLVAVSFVATQLDLVFTKVGTQLATQAAS